MAQDIAAYHRRRWPSRPIRRFSVAELVLRSPGLQLLLLHRVIHGLYARRQGDPRRPWFWRGLELPLVLPKWAIQVRTKCEIPNDSKIDSGVFFSDLGHIIYGAKTTGAGTVIGPRVTVGKSLIDAGRPKIGCNVWIGADCVIYGAISIGDGATLLPGTVLTKSIPAGVVMEGNPARVVTRKFNNEGLRESGNTDNFQLLKAILEA